MRAHVCMIAWMTTVLVHDHYYLCCSVRSRLFVMICCLLTYCFYLNSYIVHVLEALYFPQAKQSLLRISHLYKYVILLDYPYAYTCNIHCHYVHFKFVSWILSYLDLLESYHVSSTMVPLLGTSNLDRNLVNEVEYEYGDQMSKMGDCPCFEQPFCF